MSNEADNKLLIHIELDYERLADAIAMRISGEKPIYKDTDMLKTTEAAKYVGKSPSCLRNWQKLNKVLPFHIDPETLEVSYLFKDLRLYMERRNRINPSG